MVKIKLPTDIISWYLQEIDKFFKNNKIASYKEVEEITKRDMGKSFKEILMASPQMLETYAREIKDKAFVISQEDREIFLSLYKNFRARVISKRYLAKVNLKVCPYCNRNYIFNFGSKKQEATAQLDHFYDKATYPYLSLSLYNLIPSCSTCNLRKSKKDVLDEPIFNPYIDNLHNHVSFQSTSILSSKEVKKEGLDFFSPKRIDLQIINKSGSPKVDEHLDTFNIKSLYDSHKDIVAELYQKRVIYTDEYLDWLEEEFGDKVFRSREELLRLVTCGYVDDDDLHKRPLSKLIKDISQELNLI